ncbi:unnamed protein product [Closterium sp. NIES-53]
MDELANIWVQPARCTALPCPAARTPCSPRAAQLAQPCSPHAALPCSPLAAPAACAPPSGSPLAALLLPCLRRPAAAAAAARATAAAGAGGARESPAAQGASESAIALGACESAAALGARASPATGPSSAEALHTFTLDSNTSRCFFRDCTSLTPLAAPVPVSLADPTGGQVVARASTVLPYPAVHSGYLSGLHLPTFLTNLVSNAAIQDVWVDNFIPGGQRVAICQVAASSQVSASGQLAMSCSCRVLSHQTLLWHHHLSHPSIPRLHSMHSRLLISRLPRSLPSLPRSPAPPCLSCVEGRQRAALHSSEFPPTIAPLQTLHMDVWGPALVGGTDQERYFLLVVDDYTRYTTVFPLRRKADINGILIPLIHASRRQLRERFSQDFPVLCLHSDRGGDFSSDLLAEFCRDEGICQSFTLPASPQQNGIAEHRIGLIMEVARTSMIHATAPHFLWPFAVRYAVHQLNLWPRVSEPETSPTLRWTRKVGDASMFGLPHRRPTVAILPPSQDVTFDKSVSYYWLHPHTSHPVPLAPPFLVPAPPPIDPLPPQGPARSGVSRVDPPPLVEPLEISSDSSGPVEGGDPAADDTAATRCSPHLETPPGFPPLPSSPPPQHAAVDSGAETAGAEPGGAETEGEGSGGAASGGAATGGAATTGAGSWGAAAGGAGSGGPARPSGGGAVGDPTGGSPGGGGYGPAGAGAASPGGTAPAGGTRGAARAGGAGATIPGGTAGAGGAGGAAGARGIGAGGTGGAGPRGARSGGAGAAAAGGAVRAGGTAGAGGAGAGGTGDVGAAGPGGARPKGTGAIGAGGGAGAGGAEGATGAPGTGGARGTTGDRGPGVAEASGATGAGGGGGAVGAASAGGFGAGGAGAAGAGGAGAASTALCRPFFYPQPQSSLPPPDSVLRQVLSLPSSTGLPLPFLCSSTE